MERKCKMRSRRYYRSRDIKIYARYLTRGRLNTMKRIAQQFGITKQRVSKIIEKERAKIDTLEIIKNLIENK